MENPHRSILLVDDNEDDELLTIDALRNSQVEYEVFVVRDGEEALDWLFGGGTHQGRDTGHMPSLILLDLKLPKVNGLQVLMKMRADGRTRHVPTVILSSSTQFEDIAQSYENGANSYVRKEINFEKFSETMSFVCRYWLLHNQVVPRH